MKTVWNFLIVSASVVALLGVTTEAGQIDSNENGSGKVLASRERDRWVDHPEWLWFDDFEHLDDLGDSYQDYGDRDLAVSDEDAFEGNKSLRQSYSSGQVDAGWIVRYREEGFPSHLFMRWYHKFEEGFEGFPPKMARMRNRSHSSWEKPFGVYCWIEDGRVVADIKATTSTQANSSGWLPKLWSDFSFNDPENVGRWICFEMEVKLNDRGEQNGVCRIWADDQLIIEKTGLDIRGDDNLEINEVMLDGYWNGGSPKSQNRYFDNFIISTEKIGPISITGTDDQQDNGGVVDDGAADEGDSGDNGNTGDMDNGTAVDGEERWDDNPEWLWFDDFENLTNLGENYQDYSDHGFAVSDEDAVSGTKSLRQSYSSGQVDAGWVIRYREEGFPSHLFMRWYHKFEEGFEGFPPKMARMRNRSHSSWEKPFGVYCWIEDGRVVADIKATTSTQANSSGWLPKLWSDFSFNDPENVGRWICFEMEVKLNDRGEQNGVCRIWADDQLIIEKTGLDIRGDDNLEINEVMLDGYWNGGSPKNQNRYFDNFVISTQRIGPISSSGNGDQVNDGNTDVDNTPDSSVADTTSGDIDTSSGDNDTADVDTTDNLDEDGDSHVGTGDDRWENNPEWLWFDDFEDETDLSRNYHDYSNNGFEVTDADAFSGSRSLRQSYTSGQDDAGWIMRYREDGFPSHLFVRWYHKFEEGFIDFPPKMARVRHRSHSNWSSPFEVHCWIEDGKVVSDIKATQSSTQGNSSGWLPKAISNFSFNDPGNVGRWICFEMEVRLNDPGQQNGIHRIWADDDLIVEQTGLDIRGSDELEINEVMLDCYWNGGSPANQSRYFDNFVISSKRIGQVAVPDSGIAKPGSPTSVWDAKLGRGMAKGFGYSMNHVLVNNGIQFSVQLSEADRINLDVFDMHGKKIWSCSKDGISGLNKIKMKNTASGRYIVRLNLINNGISESKIVNVMN